MNDAPSQLDETLERLRKIRDAEVGQRKTIARAAATLVQPERRVSLTALQARAFALLPLVEGHVEQRLPEASRARQVIGGELDQIERHRPRRYGFASQAQRLARLLSMPLIVGSILVAIFVAPPPWGPVLVGCATVWEIVEKAFWFRSTKRIPIAVGREAMIGRTVTVISPCRPEGRVQLLGERWTARCVAGAGVGDALVIEAVEQITLVVGKPGPDLAQNI